LNSGDATEYAEYRHGRPLVARSCCW